MNHKVSTESVEEIMKYHIFVQITETQKEHENFSKIDFNSCVFERLHFHSEAALSTHFDTMHFRIVKENSQVFHETLQGAPPHLIIEKLI